MTLARLKEIEEELDALEEHKAALEEELFTTAVAVIESAPGFGSEFGSDKSVWEIPGIHKCPTSPIETCVYDETVDPNSDDCVFCHKPRERK